MPPLPPVGNMLKIMLAGVVDNEAIYGWANVLHFPYSGAAPSDADCATIGGNVANDWATHMAPECPSPTQLTNVNVIDLSSPTAGQWDTVTSKPGTRGDDSIPANAAALISYPVGTRYRGGHPRSYLYVGGNADLEGAAKWSTLFTAEFLAHWIAFVQSIQGMVVGGTSVGDLCAISYYSGVDPVTKKPIRRVTPEILPLNVLLARSRQEIASQRGRVGRRRS